MAPKLPKVPKDRVVMTCLVSWAIACGSPARPEESTRDSGAVATQQDADMPVHLDAGAPPNPDAGIVSPTPDAGDTGVVSTPEAGSDAGAQPVLIAVPQYGQLDPRWADIPYFSGGGTIGDLGCTITAVAMVARFETGDPMFDPPYINAHWPSALSAFKTQSLGPQVGVNMMVVQGDGNGSDIVQDQTPTANELLDDIRAAIRAGNPVILGMRGQFAYMGHDWFRHTVVTVGVSTDETIILNDPATGGQDSLSSYQTQPGFIGFDMADVVSHF